MPRKNIYHKNMTTLAEKVIKDCFTLADEEQLEVISRVAIQNGWNELHEIVEDLIAEQRLINIENGTDGSLNEQEFLDSLHN